MTLTQIKLTLDNFSSKLQSTSPDSRCKLLLAQFNLLNGQLEKFAKAIPEDGATKVDPEIEYVLLDAKDKIIQSMADLNCNHPNTTIEKLELWKRSLFEDVGEENLQPRDLLVLASLEALRETAMAA